MLPTSPLSKAVTNTVTIRNNTTNNLVLKEPEVSVEGVGVELKEVRPGREFAMVLSFPVGFQSKPGQAMEARVKSNDPQRPVIKVSIFQISTGDEKSTAAAQAASLRN
jgi:hypothetical protein